MTSFNQIPQTIFDLLQDSLWGRPSAPDPNTDWDSIWQELTSQTVEILALDPLVRANPANRNAYFQRTVRKLSFWYRLMSEQQSLCSLIMQQGIPCAVLKGSAAAVYYPQPTYRTMGDIDIIVKPEDFDRVCCLLDSHGYQVHHPADERHIAFHSNGVLIELHRRFSVLTNEYGRQVDDAIYKALDRTDTVTLEGFSFPMLPTPENGLVLLDHISHHMEHGLGLRQIIDWMLFADRELSDDLWYSDYQAAIQSIGLETLAVTTTRMCQMYLGLREDLTWCRTADEDLCREMMAYILDQGNFGRKKGLDHNRVMVILNSVQTLPALFKRLQVRGTRNWDAAKKHPWLKPFAWAYQGGRYVFRGLQRDQALQNLWQDAKESRQQDLFLDRLGVLRHGRGFLDAAPETEPAAQKDLPTVHI